MANIFEVPAGVSWEHELIEPLISTKDILIERIVSGDHRTAEGEWYDQDRDEWVLLVRGEATLSYDDGGAIDLKSGDYVFIPAHRRHRVERTSNPCFWLAVHAVMT